MFFSLDCEFLSWFVYILGVWYLRLTFYVLFMKCVYGIVVKWNFWKDGGLCGVYCLKRFVFFFKFYVVFFGWLIVSIEFLICFEFCLLVFFIVFKYL